MKKKNKELPVIETHKDSVLAGAITEAVCAEFMKYSGYSDFDAPLKQDVHKRVLRVFDEGCDL